MPPCMQTSVAPSAQACSARSADLVQGEGVGVGVGAALGEGAETAAGVADVGEVDVAGDDVRDVVADGVAAQVVGEPAQRVQAGPSAWQQGEGLVVGEPAGSSAALRSAAATSASSRVGAPVPGAGRSRSGLPVAVHLVEVVAAVGGAALGVDGAVQVGAPAGGREPPSGSCQAGHRRRVLAGQPGLRVGQGARRAAAAAGRARARRARTNSRVDGEAFAQRRSPPRRSDAARSSICGQGRSGLTWSGVSGETPPQSSIPAPRSSAILARRRGWAAPGSRPPGRGEPGDGDGGEQLLQFRVRHAAHRGVGLGAEVLDDDFLDAAVARGRRGGSRRASRRAPRSVSPMPIRMPVVNGTLERPGVLQDPQPDGGFLVRGAVVRAAGLGPQPGGGRLQHHAHGGRDRLEPLEVRPGHHAGVEVRQQPGLLQDADRHGPDVGERVVVAVRVQPLAGLGPAVLGPVAEGEQRFLAAEFGAAPGDVEDLVRAT